MLAKVKILGHGEECLAFAVRHGLVKLGPAQQARHRAAVNTLRQMIGDVEERHIGEARAMNRELFSQLVGDTCHTRHGLRFG
jgi:hypothetical protein